MNAVEIETTGNNYDDVDDDDDRLLWCASIRYERRLAEVFSVSDCATPTPASFYCDDKGQPQRANRTVDGRLERLNTTRFTAMSYIDEQPLLDVGSGDPRQQVTATAPADRRPTMKSVLVNFGFIWFVFLTLDVLLVTRRIGNSSRTVCVKVVSLLPVCAYSSIVSAYFLVFIFKFRFYCDFIAFC